jgi:hypothetical protein
MAKQKATPETVVCIYRVAKGNEAAFTRLLERHWPVLRQLGLVTAARPAHYRGAEQRDGRPLFFEIFEWASPDGSKLASQHPEVMEIWERMDKLTEARGDKPNMEFPHVRPLELLGKA